MNAEGSGEPRAFLLTRLLRGALAEVLCIAGNLAPGRLAERLWGWAVRADPHCEVAAANRALALLERDGRGAWAAFETVLEQLQNPRDTSASDLHLRRAPGRVARRFLSRLVWGHSAAAIDAHHDLSRQQAVTRLAEGHFRRRLAAGDAARAAQALAAWRSVAGESLAARWGAAELAWSSPRTRREARDLIEPLLRRGSFLSPLDTVRWGERLLAAGDRDLARRALRWARRLVPEIPRVWSLLGSLAWEEDRRREALHCWERALALAPQDLDTYLRRLAAERGAVLTAAEAGLEVEAPAEIALGDEGLLSCRLTGVEPEGWALHALPPAGWGVAPQKREVPFDGTGRATLVLEARRPDRLRGEAWTLLLLAVGPGSYTVERRSIEVPDPRPGELLVAVTEDHEIHEERGSLPASMLQRLLVDKSRFAADQGVPWTHMVETGSVLAMPEWAAAARGGVWLELRSAARRHLAEEALRGHDLQPHLHAFNDPDGERFPYAAGDRSWRPSLRFLLTSAERRGAWASAYPPPGSASEQGTPGGGADSLERSGPDRLQSVEKAVAELEEVGRLGDPDYRAVLWRSGLLEYGATAADRAWSAVALRRAGLLAASDLPKPGSPFAAVVEPAFVAGWEEPFAPQPGGPLLQLPVAANLEGDYLMGPRLLRRRARASAAARRGADGGVRPGVHLFTLLTHDKFINARRQRDELRLDPEYGDWRTIRRHLAAWRDAGARFVTARQGVEAVLDDRTWSPLPRLREETFLVSLDGPPEVRYRLAVLGRRIPVSETFPQHLLVPIPCSIRRHLDAVFIERQRATAGPERRAPEIEREAGAFWLRRTSGEPITVAFRLRRPVGPRLTAVVPAAENAWRLELVSPRRYRNARVLVGWPPGVDAAAASSWQARDAAGAPLECRAESRGVLISSLRFDGGGTDRPAPLQILLSRPAVNDASPPRRSGFHQKRTEARR